MAETQCNVESCVSTRGHLCKYFIRWQSDPVFS